MQEIFYSKKTHIKWNTDYINPQHFLETVVIIMVPISEQPSPLGNDNIS